MVGLTSSLRLLELFTGSLRVLLFDNTFVIVNVFVIVIVLACVGELTCVSALACVGALAYLVMMSIF